MGSLDGLRILVVEDDALIALDIEQLLRDAGSVVIGPAAHEEEALRLLADAEKPDVALLDVNLAGREAFALASHLADRSVPFLFMSGYGREILPPQFERQVLIRKPFAHSEVLKGIERTVRR